MWQTKDWIDQPAHFGLGLVATWLLSSLYPAWWTGIVAGVVVMGYAAWREDWQHRGEILNLDLIFWFAGVVTAAVVVI